MFDPATAKRPTATGKAPHRLPAACRACFLLKVFLAIVVAEAITLPTAFGADGDSRDGDDVQAAQPLAPYRGEPRIAFDANGAGGSMHDEPIADEVTPGIASVPECEFDMPKHTFAGWEVTALPDGPESFTARPSDALMMNIVVCGDGTRHDLRDYMDESGAVVFRALWKEGDAAGSGASKAGQLNGTVKGKKFANGTYKVTTRLSSSYYLTAASASNGGNVRINTKKSSNRNQQWAFVNRNSKAQHTLKAAGNTAVAIYNTGSSLQSGNAKLKTYSGSDKAVKLGVDENPGTHYSFFSAGASSDAGVLDVDGGAASDGKNVGFRVRSDSEMYNKYQGVGDSSATSGTWSGTNKSRSHWVVSKAEYTVAFNGNGATSGSTASQTHWIDSSTTLTANGFARKYTVSYNANGGSCPTGSATSTYSFKNWNTKANGSGTSYANKKSVKNLSTNFGSTVTLYAQWTSATVTLPTPSRTGYDFAGWYTAASGGSKVGNAGAAYTPGANVTLYAHWNAHTYTVTYYGNGSNGGSTARSTHTYGTARNLTANGFTRSYTITYHADGCASCPPAQTVSYGFAKWTTNANGTGNSYSNSQSVNNLTASNGGNINLYAQWNPAATTLAQADRPGYSMLGWFADPAGETKAGEAGSSFTPTANIALYARYSPNTARIVQHRNDPDAPEEAVEQTVTAGQRTRFAQVDWRKEGHVLIGWSIDPSSTGAEFGRLAMVPDSLVGDGGDVDVYAVWAAYTDDDRFTITYGANGGTGSMAYEECRFGTEYRIAECAFTREGYLFSEWNTAEDGLGAAYEPGETISDAAPPGETFSLYAQWEPVRYTVSFDSNGATGGSLADALMTYDEHAALPAGGLSCDCTVRYVTDGGTEVESTVVGKVLAGWNTQADGSGAAYALGEDVVNLNGGNDLVLYAQWEPAETPLPETSRNGYNHVGWTWDPEGDQMAGAGGELIEVTADSVLYAKWRAHRYTIVFLPSNEMATGAMENQEMEYGTPAALNRNGYRMKGFVFAGWSLSESGDALYGDGAEVADLTDEDGAEISLFATWEQARSLVEFVDPASGSALIREFTYGSGDFWPDCRWEKTGYTSMGWGLDWERGRVDFEHGTEIDDDWIEGNPHARLYAIWQPNSYQIEFDANGGDGHMEALDAVYDTPATLPECAFERQGYSFVGWSGDPQDPNGRFAPGAEALNLSEEPDSTATLYAIWRPAVSMPSSGRPDFGIAAMLVMLALCSTALALAKRLSP